jgi:hypothetical protein
MLQNEESMRFRLLYAIDGNDSLKRILRRVSEDEEKEKASRKSSELPTFQNFVCDRYLSRDFVNQFAHQQGGTTTPAGVRVLNFMLMPVNPLIGHRSESVRWALE